MSWVTTILIAVTTFNTFQPLSHARYVNKYDLPWKSIYRDFSDAPITEDSAFYPHAYPIKGIRTKRMLYDSSCKGIYSTVVISKLEIVCDACYNLYRKPYIATECRRECFNNGIFESCLYDLMMHDEAEDYSDMVREVGK